jgi:hypothetical protein
VCMPGTVVQSVRHLRRRPWWQDWAPVICLGCLGLAALLVAGARGVAAVAGLGGMFGASLTVFAAYTNYRLQQEDTARREERRRVLEQMGIAEALIADIEDNRQAAEQVHSYAGIADIWRAMVADPAYIPFLAEDEGGHQGYAAVIDRLPMLPYELVRAVVRYYAADTNPNESIAAWRSADFKALVDPKDAASVQAGRPRQQRFIIWTLLSITDIYAVALPGPAALAAADPALRAFVEAHFAAPETRAVPYAVAALDQLQTYVGDCREALDFLDAEIRRQG